MKMTPIFLILFLPVLPVLLNTLIFPCTGINVTKNGKTLFGNNEDYYTRYTYVIDFIPAATGKYGRTYWRQSDSQWVQGGMNDQGLCFDGFGTPDANITFSPEKLPYRGDLVEKIMEECATVEEAIYIINRYRFDRLQELGQFIFVDKTGDSVIVGGRNEENDVDVIRKHKNYQVVTNFFISRPELGNYPCWRYDRAEAMLEENDDATIENLRSLLDAVHFSSNASAPTLYSNICDLQNGLIYLYKMHNFQEFIIINLEEELQKGAHTYVINEIFSDVRLISPTSGETVNQGSVTFRWEGKTNSRYQLSYCTNPDFTDCASSEVGNRYSFAQSGTGIGFLFAALFYLGITVSTRKRSFPKFIIPFLMLFLLVSCQPNEDNNGITPSGEVGEVGEISATIDNLQAGTTYYWKVTANATDNFTSETIVETFTTAD